MDQMFSGCWRALARRMRKGTNGEEIECRPWGPVSGIAEGNERSEMKSISLVQRSPRVHVGQGHRRWKKASPHSRWGCRLLGPWVGPLCIGNSLHMWTVQGPQRIVLPHPNNICSCALWAFVACEATSIIFISFEPNTSLSTIPVEEFELQRSWLANSGQTGTYFYKITYLYKILSKEWVAVKAAHSPSFSLGLLLRKSHPFRSDFFKKLLWLLLRGQVVTYLVIWGGDWACVAQPLLGSLLSSAYSPTEEHVLVSPALSASPGGSASLDEGS